MGGHPVPCLPTGTGGRGPPSRPSRCPSVPRSLPRGPRSAFGACAWRGSPAPIPGGPHSRPPLSPLGPSRRASGDPAVGGPGRPRSRRQCVRTRATGRRWGGRGADRKARPPARRLPGDAHVDKERGCLPAVGIRPRIMMPVREPLTICPSVRSLTQEAATVHRVAGAPGPGVDAVCSAEGGSGDQTAAPGGSARARVGATGTGNGGVRPPLLGPRHLGGSELLTALRLVSLCLCLPGAFTRGPSPVVGHLLGPGTRKAGH